MLVGGAVLAAVLVAGVLFIPRGGETAGPAPSSTAMPAAATVTIPTGQQSGAADSGAVTAAGAPASATAAPPVSPASSDPALAEDIRAVTKLAGSESTARRALDEARRLDGLAKSNEDRVSVAMARAQAYGTLGQDARSCKSMKDVEAIANGTSHETQIREMLAICAKL
jgi:hypothetical protein